MDYELLEKGIEQGFVQYTDVSRKLTIDGQTKAYQVYKIRLDKLFYNDQNDRIATWISKYISENGELNIEDTENYNDIIGNQRIIAGNVQFKGIAAGRGVGFTTGLLLLRKGLGMQETPIRPHSWHCRMQSDYQYDGNRKRPPVWRRHRGSLRPRGRNLGRVEGMTGSCGSGCDPAIHARRLRVYHRPRRLRMASRISIFFAARRFEPLNSMG